MGLDDFHDPVRGVKHVDWGIDFMCRQIDMGELDMNPDYQRGHVWTPEQQSDFVGFMLEGGRPPEVFVREFPLDRDDPKPPYYEIVDGKQRFTALHAWWTGKIAARLSAEHGHRLIWVEDLNEVELRNVKLTKMTTSVQFLDCDRAKTLRVYLRLNRGGTPHSDAEIERVRALYEAEIRRDP